MADNASYPAPRPNSEFGIVSEAGHPRQNGDEAKERVGRLYERYASHVTAYAMRRASRSDAADVVAETFLVAWRRRDAVPDEPKTLPWLYGVARRVLANQRRSTHRRTQLRDRLRQQLDLRHWEPTTDHVEHLSRVEAALNVLSYDDAEILRLTAWEDLRPSEIAEVLDMAPGTVRQRLRRARIRLRKQLAIDGFPVDAQCELIDGLGEVITLDTESLDTDSPDTESLAPTYDIHPWGETP